MEGEPPRFKTVSFKTLTIYFWLLFYSLPLGNNLFASLWPVSVAPWTVEKWWLSVASPANSTLGAPLLSTSGSARIARAFGYKGVCRLSYV